MARFFYLARYFLSIWGGGSKKLPRFWLDLEIVTNGTFLSPKTNMKNVKECVKRF